MVKSAEGGQVSRRGKDTRPGGRASGEKELARAQFFGLKKWQYIAINAFLIFHTLAICCWCMPFGSPFVAACRETLRPYFVWSGLFQSSCRPVHLAYHLEEDRDGVGWTFQS